MELTVWVTPLIAPAELHEDDKDVPGQYIVEIDDDVGFDQAAGVAKDVFHDHVAVKVLDDFVFSVRYGDAVLMEPDDYEPMQNAHRGSLVGKDSEVV